MTPHEVREAILQCDLRSSEDGGPIRPGSLYVPPAHVKALRLDAALVVGGRGVGKSFWTAALSDRDLRARLSRADGILDRTDVSIGYSTLSRVDSYPDEATFAKLLSDPTECQAFDVWRAVIYRALASSDDAQTKRLGDWGERVRWVQANPEALARRIEAVQKRYHARDRHALVVFDALDRTSNDWGRADEILRDLLRTALWVRSFPNLHVKVFLRDDQFTRTIADFPDASKLLATKAELTWDLCDLHGLLWQRLGNGPGRSGQVLRDLAESASLTAPFERLDGGFELARGVKTDERWQRRLFHRLAGDAMGRGKRRGVPYTWIYSHLADGNGQASPRSFLAAVRAAAEDSLSRYEDSDHPYPLHYESIKRGIRKASRNRVDEIGEDYPWVKTVASALEGENVPIDRQQVYEIWQDRWPNGVPQAVAGQDKLPPPRTSEGWAGVAEDLRDIGVFQRRRDGRIDMPDLYRVGFGLGRKGGVKPRA